MNFVLPAKNFGVPAVGIIVGVRGGLAVLVGHGSPASARIVRKCGRGGIGIGDRREPGHGVIGKRGLMRKRIWDQGPVALRVVGLSGHVVLRIGDGGAIAHLLSRETPHPSQRA